MPGGRSLFFFMHGHLGLASSSSGSQTQQDIPIIFGKQTGWHHSVGLGPSQWFRPMVLKLSLRLHCTDEILMRVSQRCGPCPWVTPNAAKAETPGRF